VSAFLAASAIRAAVAGSWLRSPSDDVVPDGVTIDSRGEILGKLFVAIRGERFDGNDFAGEAARQGAAIVMVDRDVPHVPASAGVLYVPDARRALGQLASAWREQLTRVRVVAITGSAGKTTTRRLVDGVLGAVWKGSASPKSFNNDIGVPLTLLAARRDDEYLVVEIGMNHPGEIHSLASIARPNLAIITMVGRAHLAGLGSVEAIAREKTSLLDALPGAGGGGIAIVNGDQPLMTAAIEARRLRLDRLIRFGVSPSADLRLTCRRTTGGSQEIEIDGAAQFTLNLPGEHNAMNALAAIVVGRELGLPDEAIRRGLASVEPSGMRLERIDVPVQGGTVTLYNDAYNANPDAMAASIRAFAELSPTAKRRVLVLGDMLELGDASADLHREVGAVAAQVSTTTPIHAAIAVGSFAEYTREGLATAGWRGDALVLSSFDDAQVARAVAFLRAGDVALVKGSRGARMERLVTAIANPVPR